MVHETEVLNKIFTHMCDDAGIKNPYSASDWKCDYVKMSKDVFILKIVFPEPIMSPLAYSAYIVFDRKFEKIRYFTLELCEGIFGGKGVIIGEMGEGEKHLNYGSLEEHGLSIEDEKIFHFTKCTK